MIHLDDEIARRVDNAAVPDGCVCYVATASPDGEPELGPKGSMMVFDKDHLAFWEYTRRAGYRNLKENPRAVVVYRNPEAHINWRFHGIATIYEEGPIREQVMARTIPSELARDPERKGVAVLIRVDRMTTFGSEVLQER